MKFADRKPVRRPRQWTTERLWWFFEPMFSHVLRQTAGMSLYSLAILIVLAWWIFFKGDQGLALAIALTLAVTASAVLLVTVGVTDVNVVAFILGLSLGGDFWFVLTVLWSGPDHWVEQLRMRAFDYFAAGGLVGVTWAAILGSAQRP